MLHLDFGEWHDGRILGGPSGVSSAEANVRDIHVNFRDDAGQWAELSVRLPAESYDAITFTFDDALVIVAGPWQVPFTVR